MTLIILGISVLTLSLAISRQSTVMQRNWLSWKLTRLVTIVLVGEVIMYLLIVRLHYLYNHLLQTTLKPGE